MARSHRRTWLYVGREFLLSFAVAFLFFFFLFFLNQILIMAEEIFSKKVAFGDILLLILYSLPVVIAFSFPFGSLVGALMAVGRLSSDNELLAFGSLGVPPRQLLAPLLVMGLAFSLVSFIMNDYFMPLGNIRFTQIYRRVLFSNPGLELAPYTVQHEGATAVITGAVDGRRIRDIMLIDKSPEGNRRIILARDAQLDQSADPNVISLTLDGVFTQLSYPRDGDRYDYTLAERMVYSLKLADVPNATIGSRTPSGMSSADVWKEVVTRKAAQDAAARQSTDKAAGLAFRLSAGLRATEKAVAVTPAFAASQRAVLLALWRDLAAERGRNLSDQTLQSYLVEFHRKFSMPAACLVFAFFAFPVGLRARRSGRTVGFGVGLLVAIIYWGLLIAGQTFGVRMSLSPAFSMWLPDAAVLAAGTALFVGRLRR